MAGDVMVRYMDEMCSEDVLRVVNCNRLQNWPRAYYQDCLMTEEASRNHACPWSFEEVDRCREAIPPVLKTKNLSSLAVRPNGNSLLGSHAFHEAMVTTPLISGQAPIIRCSRPWQQSCVVMLDGQQVITGLFSMDGREIDRPGGGTYVQSLGYDSDTLVKVAGSSKFQAFSSIMKQMLTCEYYINPPTDVSLDAVYTETVQELAIVVKKKKICKTSTPA
jgi:hypothetical protein